MNRQITFEMTPQDKEIYFAHQKKRHREEQEKIEQERVQLKSYKDILIEDILKINQNFTYEELKRKSIRVLERIFDFY